MEVTVPREDNNFLNSISFTFIRRNIEGKQEREGQKTKHFVISESDEGK